jgi:hypothetical protein
MNMYELIMLGSESKDIEGKYSKSGNNFFQRGPGALSSSVRWSEHEADHALPSNADM